MGAPKHKWTAEEELALNAGIEKHGAGKWRTILKDPEFSHILYLRSNVDLKDKWRNTTVAAHGWGSRDRARISWKRTQAISKHNENPLPPHAMDEDFDDEIVDTKPLTVSNETMWISEQDRSVMRLDNIILEAITNLNEPGGSSMTAIAMYIEDQYWSPPNLESMLSSRLKTWTASGKLIKVKRKYILAPSSGFPGFGVSRMPPLEKRLKEFGSSDRSDFKTPTKSQIDAEMAKMRNMTSREAAAFAARAMAEAEAAMLEAEEAAREAEIAEADAESAQAFAEAARLTIKNRTTSKPAISDGPGEGSTDVACIS